MLKKFFVGLSVFVLVGALAVSSTMAQIFVDNRLRTSPAGFAPDEILVRFRPGADVDATNQRIGAISATITYSGVYRVKVPPDRFDELLEIYNNDPGVEYAERNYIRRATMLPNDTLYSLQWHLDNPAYGGIEMEQAWDIEPGGNPNVIVAVIDTGVSYEDYDVYCLAPDLANTTFVPGWDVVNNDAHPNDDHSHGTHVTGTIAQSTNNGLGVAGVAFNTAIMPVKVLDEDGSGWDSDVADGIRWATDHGANIINMSLGGPPSITLKNECTSAYIKGVTIVAASGNDNGPVGYPAAYEEVIAVGATRYDETRAWYSNYGDSLDLVAPGGDLGVDQNDDGEPDGVLQQTFGGDPCKFGYYWKQGTSMASPHVAGVAALLHAQGVTHPDDVRDRLQSTADDLGAPGRDNYYGWGLVNAERALKEHVPQPPVADADGPYNGTIGEPILFDGTGSYDPDGAIVSYEWDFGDGDTGTGPTPTHAYANDGVYTVTLTVTDNDGLTGTDDTTATVGIPDDLVLQDIVIDTTEVYQANNSITAGPSVLIIPPGDVIFRAGNKIILKPGFTAQSGSKFHAHIGLESRPKPQE